jgi:N-acyl-phosphatidylethanolamine-hydrolysing phospholipase D
MMQAKDIKSKTAHHSVRGFQNPWPGGALHGIGSLMKWMLTRSEREASSSPPAHFIRPVLSASRSRPVERRQALTVTWVGHSSFLIQCAGLNILTDPVWSERASPVSFAGPRRMVPPGLSLDELPPIDITLVSHDHYDHLDDDTIRQLISRFPNMKWMAPLRVGDFLRKRGAADVTELDWWNTHDWEGLSFGCTPAQHFSGRYPWNRNATLWCGWTVTFPNGARLYFAGDTGLHPEFSLISAEFGPFDMAILPIGAYEPRWFMRPVHMTPEDSVKAYQDIEATSPACVMVGSHWGTFRLTTEPVMEPPALTRSNWSAAGLDEDRLWILEHGETRTLTADESQDTRKGAESIVR